MRRNKTQWLIAILALLGGVLNAAEHWQGFVCWVVTNTYWCVYNWRKHERAQAVVFAVFLVLSIWGIWRWRQ